MVGCLYSVFVKLKICNFGEFLCVFIWIAFCINCVNTVTQNSLYGLFSNLEHTLIMMVPRWFINTLITSSAGPVYIRDPHPIIAVPADVLAPNGARPSAGTVMTGQLNIFLMKFLWLEVFLSYHFWPDDIIQNERRDLGKSLGSSNVNIWRLVWDRQPYHSWGVIKSHWDNFWCSRWWRKVYKNDNIHCSFSVLTNLSMGDLGANLKVQLSNLFHWYIQIFSW